MACSVSVGLPYLRAHVLLRLRAEQLQCFCSGFKLTGSVMLHKHAILSLPCFWSCT